MKAGTGAALGSRCGARTLGAASTLVSRPGVSAFPDKMSGHTGGVNTPVCRVATLRDARLLPQVRRAMRHSIQVTVDAHKGLASEQLAWGVDRGWQAAVQVPGDKQGLARRIDVGEAATLEAHANRVPGAAKASQSDAEHRQECRCGRQECPRHRRAELRGNIGTGVSPTTFMLRPLRREPSAG